MILKRDDMDCSALLDRVNQGDVEALQVVIIRQHAILWRVVDKTLPDSLRDRVDTDDVLQDAYVAMFERFDKNQYPTMQELVGWLRTVTLNHARETIRRHQSELRDRRREVRCQRGRRDSLVDLLRNMSGDDGNPSDLVQLGEAVAVMMTCLARLPEGERNAIRYRMLEQWPTPKVAEHLNRSEAAIYGLCTRGLRRLHEMMGRTSKYFLCD